MANVDKTKQEEIDWKKWESYIKTPEIVAKIKEKYEAFMKAEYDIDNSLQKMNEQSDKYK